MDELLFSVLNRFKCDCFVENVPFFGHGSIWRKVFSECDFDSKADNYISTYESWLPYLGIEDLMNDDFLYVSCEVLSLACLIEGSCMQQSSVLNRSKWRIVFYSLLTKELNIKIIIDVLQGTHALWVARRILEFCRKIYSLPSCALAKELRKPNFLNYFVFYVVDDDKRAILAERDGFNFSMDNILMFEPCNVVYYGPPGTGKTHALNSEIRVYENRRSISTDSAWIQENVEGLGWWEVLFMALYEHKQKASISELIEHPFILEKRQLSKLSEAETRSICWEALQSHTTVDAANARRDVNTRRVPYVFDMDLDNSYHLARSGDWKESCAVLIERVEQIMAGPSDEERKIDKRYAFVTFHQSYSYEDFIEGIRPEPAPHGQGVSYAVKPGVFKRLCERARRDPEQRYAIFIDEINRGNVAKIFGELITLIEIDKRARYDIDGNLLQGMELTLPYSGERFGVPFNVDIFGTMNTADRSIALLDVALRRRFEFVELMPQPDVIPGNDGEGNILDTENQPINLRQLLAAINKRIEYFLHRDQTIGHAFFMSVTTLEELKEVLAKKIIPLLQETFYNNWENIRLVLGDVNVPIACQLVRKITVSVEDVFGFAHDELPDSTRYDVCDVSDMTAAAIRSIYEPVV